jgi:hypothetical protein
MEFCQSEYTVCVRNSAKLIEFSTRKFPHFVRIRDSIPINIDPTALHPVLSQHSYKFSSK